MSQEYYYDPIVSIEMAGAMEMYDLEVDDDHSYTVNGYICHNCQGLEFPVVILAFIKAHGKFLLQRNLLYTALTRAKKKVIVMGQASALEQAIANDKMQKRNTMFAERIKGWSTGQGIPLRALFSEPESSPNAKNLGQLLLLEEHASVPSAAAST